MADVKELNVNNTTYDIKAKSVVDTNSGKLSFWSGTKAQYDAILSKDSNTLYEVAGYGVFIGTTQIAAGSSQLNNPFSLLDYKYGEYELDNASWLLSNGQWNNGAVYTAVYNLLLAIYNGTITKAGVSVKLSTETYADTDFVLNTGDTTFRLPTKVLMAGSKRVAGNGMTLGFTNGTQTGGLASIENLSAAFQTNQYGSDVGTTTTGSYFTDGKTVGITTDETKSGIETSANGLYLYFYVGETVQDANVIAAGQALTDIANLKAHYITETYINGTSWYRVYSDGWCEQGGELVGVTDYTVSFLKQFANTNYLITVGGYDYNSPDDTNYCTIQWRDKTIAGVRFQAGWYGALYATTIDWRACGYIS